jgi:hypothetical protein
VCPSCLLCLVLFAGCFYFGKDQIEEILDRPSSSWSSRDGLTILMQTMVNNLLDQNSSVVKAIVTPYYPAVIAALNRTDQRSKHLSEEQFRKEVDQQVWEDLGLLLSLSNTSWPCVSPMIVTPAGIFPMFGPNNFPCYTPDISHLEECVYLINDKNDTLRATSVRGRRWDVLASEETILVKFRLRDADRIFLKGVDTFYLIVSGFDRPLPQIKLEFQVSVMKLAFSQF